MYYLNRRFVSTLHLVLLRTIFLQISSNYLYYALKIRFTIAGIIKIEKGVKYYGLFQLQKWQALC